MKDIIKKIFKENWDKFLDKYGKRTRKVVQEEVEKMMKCGSKENGYIKIKCPECGNEKIVGFTCKSRICSSCGKIRMDDFAEELKGRLINTKHRHMVFTIPDELRIIFMKEKELLKILSDAVAEVIRSWYYDMNHKEEYMPGIVTVIHTFGRDMKWNPHVHALITEGAMGKSKGWKKVWYIPYEMLRERWQKVLLDKIEMIVGKRKFKEQKNKLYKRLKDGFYVYAKKKEVTNEKELIKYIGRYIGRPAIAESRIIKYENGKVRFWYQRHEDDKRVEEEIDVEEFIGRIIMHVPERNFKMVRYYGIYSRNNRYKGKFIQMVKKEVMEQLRKFRKWKWRIEKTYKVDPMKCEKCGTQMILYEIHFMINGNEVICDTKEKIKYEMEQKLKKLKATYELTSSLGKIAI